MMSGNDQVRCGGEKHVELQRLSGQERLSSY